MNEAFAAAFGLGWALLFEGLGAAMDDGMSEVNDRSAKNVVVKIDFMVSAIAISYDMNC